MQTADRIRQIVRGGALGLAVRAVLRRGVFPLVALTCVAFMVLMRVNENEVSSRTLQGISSSHANQRTNAKEGRNKYTVHRATHRLEDENIGALPMVVHN